MDFEREVARHKDAVYKQMLRVCGNREDAEDVLVEAMVKAYSASNTLGDPAAFRAWLTTIGKRVCIRLKQRKRAAQALSLDAMIESGVQFPSSGELTAEDELNLEETQHCLQHAFEGLPDHYRKVYKLREIEGRTAEETAKLLGISVPNVKARLHRARLKVRKELDASLCE
jgi:RNA polymerase sigma-70 factor (ECF subfamily)